MIVTERRLQAAERRFHDRGGCPGCESRPREYEVVWVGDEASLADEPEFCSECGRSTSHTVTWGPEPRE